MPILLSRPNPFQKSGKWFKGSIHFHTTASDGKLTPGQAMAFFKSNGYDFVSFGDHWNVTVPENADGKILVIPGCEIDTWKDETVGNTHIMCVGVHGISGNFRPKDYLTVRPCLRDMWEQAKAISEYQVLAHPYWSTRSPEFIKSYEGLQAIEVYNHNFDRSHDMGYAEYAWHMLLNEGCRFDATAVDDAHHPEEFGQAWLMVRAEECTQPAIIQALKDGDFYSTRGPRILSVDFTEDRIRITTTPVRRITFRTTQFFGGVLNAPEGETITSGETKIDLKEMELVRVELTDLDGRKAWSNPFYFSNSQVRPPINERGYRLPPA